MLAWLHQPLRPEKVIAIGVAMIAAVAFYCLAYNALAGKQETLAQAIAWGVSNILPWWLAFEAVKRVECVVAKGFVVAGALVISLAIDPLLSQGEFDFGFELIRRIPAFLGLTALVGIGLAVARRSASGRASTATNPPLSAEQSDWIAAAGNYVELHGSGHTVVHRASLRSIEERLGAYGFVRIHRSVLVRRDRIARIRSEDVILADGTSLKLGKRYRANLSR